MRCLLRIPRCSRSVRSFARQPTALRSASDQFSTGGSWQCHTTTVRPKLQAQVRKVILWKSFPAPCKRLKNAARSKPDIGELGPETSPVTDNVAAKHYARAVMKVVVSPISVQQAAFSIWDIVAILLILGLLVFFAEASRNLGLPLDALQTTPIGLDPWNLPGYLPWGFAMASGQLPQREPPRPREGHAGLLFAVPTRRTPARGSTRGKGALLRRQYSRRRYVVGRRWRSDDGRSDVCHISGTNLHRLANVADNLPPSVQHRLSCPVTVRRVKRLRIAWVSYKAGGR